MLANAERHLSHLPDRFETDRARALDDLRAAFAPYAERPLRHHTIFGDFKPENLCLTPDEDRLTGIDYVRDRPQPIERDTAFLLQWMRQRNWRRSLQRTGWIEPEDETANRAAALGVLNGALDPGLLAAYEKLFLLQLLVEVALSGREPLLLETVRARMQQ